MQDHADLIQGHDLK